MLVLTKIQMQADKNIIKNAKEMLTLLQSMLGMFQALILTSASRLVLRQTRLTQMLNLALSNRVRQGNCRWLFQKTSMLLIEQQ